MAMTIATIEDAENTLVKALQTHAYQAVAFAEHGIDSIDANKAIEQSVAAQDCADALAVLVGPVEAERRRVSAYRRANLIVNGN